MIVTQLRAVHGHWPTLAKVARSTMPIADPSLCVEHVVTYGLWNPDYPEFVHGHRTL